MASNTALLGADAFSRPYVLDMPDEVLLQIFGYLKVPPVESSDFVIGAQEIKNVRLTCRRFCNTSSHLLIDVLSVALDSLSLSHLKEVSLHPTISKGVKAVIVTLGFYDAETASKIELFAAGSVDALSSYIDKIERFGETFQLSEAVRTARTERAEAISDSFQGVAERIPVDTADEEDRIYRKLLRRGHREYRRRFEDQERLLKDDVFFRDIAAAFAKMPSAKRLEIQDNRITGELKQFGKNRGRGDYFTKDTSDEALFEVLIQEMLVPLEWEEADRQGCGPPPVEVLVRLPAAIHKAGVWLTSLEIRISHPDDFSLLLPSEEELQNLTNAMQSLQLFRFRLRSEDYSFEPKPNEVEDLKKFLSAILETDSMEDLTLDFGCLWNFDEFAVNIGSIINLRPWEKLSVLDCSAVYFDLADLERFLDRRVAGMTSLSMRNMYLLSGTWADGLDMLRQKSRHITFEDPTGAELIGDRATFVEGIIDSGKAEQYVQGLIEQNPLRDFEQYVQGLIKQSRHRGVTHSECDTD